MTNDWQSWIGRETHSEAHFDPMQANRMAVTLGREPEFQEGDLLPHAWHWLYFHDLVPAGKLGRDGHPALGVTMPPVPLERRMWAAGALHFNAPLRLGDRATRTSRIASIVPKSGRSGELYFVTIESEVAVDSRVALRETQSIVYRELTSGGSGAAIPAPAAADFSSGWELDTVALFRYSALTFNSHRIHYDADYARDIEGYSGLVIHGPLIATLLLDAAKHNAPPIRSFEFRAKSPLLLPDPFTVHGTRDPDAVKLWATNADGGLAMEASAQYATAEGSAA